eukprot:1158623-Pelagomonas_calceolata.AAC.14
MSNEKVSMHLLRRQGKRGHAFIAVAAKVVHAFVEATAKLAMHSLQPQPKRPSVVQTHRRCHHPRLSGKCLPLHVSHHTALQLIALP